MARKSLWKQNAVFRANAISTAFEAQALRVAEEVGAERLVLLAFSDYAILRSISFVISSDSSDALKVATHLAESEFLFSHPIRGGQIESALQHLAYDRNPKQATSNPGLDGLAPLFESLNLNHLRVIGSEQPPEAVRLAIFSELEIEPESHAKELEDLLELAGLLPQAAVHRDSRIMASFGTLLNTLLWQDIERDSERALDELLTLTLEACKADGASLYTREPAKLNLVRRFWVARPDCAAHPREEISPEDDTPGARATSGRPHTRAVVDPSRSDWLGVDEESHELALPLLAVPGGETYPSMGVLCVTRLEARPFSSHQIALAGDLALRIAFLLEQLRIEDAADESRLGLMVRAGQAFGDRYRPPDGDTSWIPSDLMPAAPSVAVLLDVIAMVSLCDAATVRLLIPSTQRGHRYELRRLAVWPPDESHQLTIHLSDQASVNAWVARSGLHCYLPDVRRRESYFRFRGLKDYKPVRPDTRSELCLPLALHGRIIGTVNLESRNPNNFALRVNQIRALCRQMELVFENSRFGIGLRLVDSTTHLKTNLHRLDAIAADLDGVARRLNDPELSRTAHRLKQLDYSSRDTAEWPALARQPGVLSSGQLGANGGHSIRSTIEAALTQSGLELRPRFDSRLPSASLSDEVATYAFEALLDVFSKIIASSPIESRVRGVHRRGTIGGRAFTDYCFQYDTVDAVGEKLPQMLYHAPVPSEPDAPEPSYRSHLGSYIAASILKRIDCELSLVRLGDTRVEVVLSAPEDGHYCG